MHHYMEEIDGTKRIEHEVVYILAAAAAAAAATDTTSASIATTNDNTAPKAENVVSSNPTSRNNCKNEHTQYEHHRVYMA